jgi:TonB family protein
MKAAEKMHKEKKHAPLQSRGARPPERKTSPGAGTQAGAEEHGAKVKVKGLDLRSPDLTASERDISAFARASEPSSPVVQALPADEGGGAMVRGRGLFETQVDAKDHAKDHALERASALDNEEVREETTSLLARLDVGWADDGALPMAPMAGETAHDEEQKPGAGHGLGTGAEGAGVASAAAGSGGTVAAGPGGAGHGLRIRGLRPPQYPLLARLRGEEGSVEIGVRVGPGGRLLGSRVLSSSGFVALDRAALKAVRRARFVVPSDVWEGAPSEKAIVFVFRLKDSDGY